MGCAQIWSIVYSAWGAVNQAPRIRRNGDLISGRCTPDHASPDSLHTLMVSDTAGTTPWSPHVDKGNFMSDRKRNYGGGFIGAMKKTEHGIESMLFNGRWLLVPFYVGLLLGLFILVLKFAQEFIHLVSTAPDSSLKATTISLLELLDIVLLANLILIVIFSGYENFVSKIAVAQNAEDRPSWMGKVDFSGLKIKLIGSLVAISVIQLLAVFLEPGQMDTDQIFWMIMIHLTFVVSGVLFAVMDYIADKRATIDIAAERAVLELRILEKQHGFAPGHAEKSNPTGE
jgi:uncharacterized protein (TIGR00645 family)